MLIDVHAHFLTERSCRADWQEVNRARLEAGRRMGITAHVASILGTWGARSPVYFPSKDDVTHANDALLSLIADHSEVYGYCVVNPNFSDHALAEIERRVAQGMIGVKLAASRRADDALLHPIAELAGHLGVPILHHVWHGRTRDWPGQEASDGSELTALATRFCDTQFILAHIGGGGDWAHSLRAICEAPNVWVDLSGSGVDIDMVERLVHEPGIARVLFGSDLTMDTAWAKLRYLEALQLTGEDLDLVRFGNAEIVFPTGAFRADH